MSLLRRAVPAWLLVLIVASCLLARPLHEALDACLAAGPVTAQSLSSAEGPAGQDDGSPDTEAAACAWCVMLAQAQGQAPADAAVAPVVRLATVVGQALPCEGLPAGRCVLAAPPRGPPQA